jgi:nitrogen-specific signal transduction histidine kinase
MNGNDADSSATIDELRSGIRQICHDLSNPIGILRMAVYYLQTSQVTPEKRTHYFATMTETLDKLENHLKRLRAMAGDAEKRSASEEPRP